MGNHNRLNDDHRKYFESCRDFVNVMRVCKRYHDLIQMYHFNPISDWRLFENMETQDLYGEKDRKKEGLKKYVYWYSNSKLKKNKKRNEIIKRINTYKYVVNNVNKLE